jgi:hypothetical protein
METFARLEDLIWRQPVMETFARMEDLIWRQPDMETFARLEDLDLGRVDFFGNWQVVVILHYSMLGAFGASVAYLFLSN